MTERTNSNRAISAHVAATAYQNYTGSDNWALVTDLVCDLMHLANETGQDALEHVHLAILHWHSETYGGEPQPGESGQRPCKKPLMRSSAPHKQQPSNS
jgi:hypothetical protein